MPAINFREEFADYIQVGTKTTTIRRRGRIKAGQELKLYTGQRTKFCRLLRTTLCLGVTPVVLAWKQQIIYLNGFHVINDFDFVRRDTAGLWSVEEFWSFFETHYRGDDEAGLFDLIYF